MRTIIAEPENRPSKPRPTKNYTARVFSQHPETQRRRPRVVCTTAAAVHSLAHARTRRGLRFRPCTLYTGTKLAQQSRQVEPARAFGEDDRASAVANGRN